MTGVGSATEELNAKEAALWLFQMMNPSAVIHVPIAFRATDQKLRWWPIKVAVDHLVAAHPALRTVFPEVDGTPTRVVLDSWEADVETVATSAETLAEDLSAFARRPFQFTEEPPFRVGHFTGDPAGDVVCFTSHHLISDAQSCGILLGTFLEIYQSVAAGTPVPERFTRTIEPFREPPSSDVDLAFWREHLAGAGERSRALSMTEPGEGDDYRGQQAIRPVTAATVAKLESVSRELNASPAVVLLSAYYLLLANHGAGDDIVVGMPLDARGPDRRDSIGYHVNIVGLRGRLDFAVTFREWARVVRDNFLNGLRHVRASIDESVPGSYDTASDWREPIMRYTFNYSPYISGLSTQFGIHIIPIQLGYSRVDLGFNIFPRADDQLIVASYRDQGFPRVAVERLIERYITLLDACLADLELPLRDYPLWSDTDRGSVSALTVDAAALPAGLAQVDAAALSIRDAIGRILPVGLWGELYHGDSGTGSVARWGWTGSLEFAPSGGPGRAAPAESPEGAQQRAASTGDSVIETTLVELWRELLDRPDSDDRTHFFRAGGTSLKAARIVIGIRNKLGIKVKLRQVFATPTPAGLAAAISSSAEERP